MIKKPRFSLFCIGLVRASAKALRNMEMTGAARPVRLYYHRSQPEIIALKSTARWRLSRGSHASSAVCWVGLARASQKFLEYTVTTGTGGREDLSVDVRRAYIESVFSPPHGLTFPKSSPYFTSVLGIARILWRHPRSHSLHPNPYARYQPLDTSSAPKASISTPL